MQNKLPFLPNDLVIPIYDPKSHGVYKPFKVIEYKSFSTEELMYYNDPDVWSMGSILIDGNPGWGNPNIHYPAKLFKKINKYKTKLGKIFYKENQLDVSVCSSDKIPDGQRNFN